MSQELFPVTELHKLDHLPVVLLVYESGSSGEFLAAALSQSLEGFYQAEIKWENNWRCLFQDSFGRALSWGHHVIDYKLLLRNFDHVLMTTTVIDQHYIVTVHPRPVASMDFVLEYLSSRPMIKITCQNKMSKQFRKLSCFYKLKGWDRDINNRLNLENEQGWVTQFTNPAIEVEWQDIVLNHPKREFERIQEFLGQQGNWEVFSQMLQDYVARNQEILQKIPIDQ